jgi:hypothetical protein
MDLEKDPRIERLDPNAPKTLDLAKCQQMIRSAPQHARFPLGDVVQVMAEQLKCAVDELSTSSTKVTDANNQMLRYQKEAETANSEVRTMQSLLGTAREEARIAKEELAALKDKIALEEKARAEAAVPKLVPRARRGKIVPIDPPKTAQG